MKHLAGIFFTLILSLGYTQSDSLENSILDGTYLSPYLPDGHFVEVQLVNKTGYTIDSVLFYNTFFPRIASDSSTDFFITPNYVDGEFIRGSIPGELVDGGMYIWNCNHPPYAYEKKKIIVSIRLKESEFHEGYMRLVTKLEEVVR